MDASDHMHFAAEVALLLAGASENDVDRVVTDALGGLAEAVGADRAYVTVYDDDGTFGNGHEWTAAGVIPQRPAIQRLSVDRFPYSSGLAKAGVVLSVERLEDWPPEAQPEHDSFGSFGVNSVLQVPIRVDGELLGVIGFNHIHRTERWSPEAIERVRLVGRAIGVALSRRVASQQARRSLALAEQASQAKDDLIARASHELRTPLHAVVGFAEILELDGVRHEALSQIQRNSRVLLGMIDDLLELGRLAASTDDSGMLSLGQLLDGVIANLLPVAKLRGVSLSSDGPLVSMTTPSATVRVRQILHCVTAAAIESAGRGGSVTVVLLDAVTGSEITFRIEGPDHSPPTGFGLSLATSFAEDLSGSVTSFVEGDSARIVVTCPKATVARGVGEAR